jgi:hypothetical protein
MKIMGIGAEVGQSNGISLIGPIPFRIVEMRFREFAFYALR